MQTAPIPHNENQRLASLKKLHILDTPSEERFDRVTKLATRIFSLPISTISIIDEHREWFKSVCGLDKTEGDRAISFCGHALTAEDVFIVPDTKEDARFIDNPMVTGEPFIRFYAGVPLFAADGARIGAFCVKDIHPRTFTDEDIQALTSLAHWVQLEINNRDLSLSLETIQKQSAELDSFFNLSVNLMCIAGKDGYFKRVNQKLLSVLGYSEQELFAQPFMAIVHQDDVLATIEEVKKVSSGEKTNDFKIRCRKKDGSYIWLQWSATPQGENFFAVAQDITKNKEAETKLLESYEEIKQMNSLMTGRELRMIELKETIKHLETSLAEAEKKLSTQHT